MPPSSPKTTLKFLRLFLRSGHGWPTPRFGGLLSCIQRENGSISLYRLRLPSLRVLLLFTCARAPEPCLVVTRPSTVLESYKAVVHEERRISEIESQTEHMFQTAAAGFPHLATLRESRLDHLASKLSSLCRAFISCGMKTHLVR